MPHITQPGLIPRSPPPVKTGRGQRLCREVLREGSWLTGNDPSDPSAYLSISPATLDAFKATAIERAASGLLVPLQWDHNPDNGLHTESQNVIDYFEEFWLETHEHGQSLWAACYPGERFDELNNCKLPVSPHLQATVADGTGKVWRNVILHVALVDHATIPSQNGFVAMALPNASTGTDMDISKVIALLNTLLEMVKPGVAIPESITDEAGLDTAMGIITSMLGGNCEADPAEEDIPDPGVPAVPDAVAMSLKSLESQVAKLTAKLAIVEGQKAQDAEAAFAEAVDGAIAMGLPATCKPALLNVGKATNWDISQIDPFKAMGKVSMGLQSPKHLKTDTPSNEDAELAATLRATGMDEEAIKRQLARY